MSRKLFLHLLLKQFANKETNASAERIQEKKNNTSFIPSTRFTFEQLYFIWMKEVKGDKFTCRKASASWTTRLTLSDLNNKNFYNFLFVQQRNLNTVFLNTFSLLIERVIFFKRQIINSFVKYQEALSPVTSIHGHLLRKIFLS